MKDTMEIIVFDGHPVVTGGIAGALDGCDYVSCVRDAVADETPDSGNICIIEADCRGNGGLAVIERLLSASPRCRVVVYTMHDEEWLMRQVLAMGVDGAVLKSESLGELVRVVNSVAAGGRCMSAAFRDVETTDGSDSVAPLSGRESQVLAMLARGKTSGRIASELCLSVNTVQTYRQRIMEKFGVSNVAELVYQTKGLV